MLRLLRWRQKRKVVQLLLLVFGIGVAWACPRIVSRATLRPTARLRRQALHQAGRHPAHEEAAQAVDLLAALRTGRCSASSIPTLDLRLLPASEERPLAGVRCPVVLLGAFERCGLGEASEHWADWEELSCLLGGEHVVQYDKNEDSSVFTYWDNGTALAEGVRSQNLIEQGYKKENASTLSFLKQIQEGGAQRPWVRYGSSMHTFAPSLAHDLNAEAGSAGRLAPLVASHVAENVLLHLWASSPGVTSTAHYDPGWENAHFVVAGAKHVALAPLTFESVRTLQIRPGTHPHNRQARLSLFASNGSDGSGVVEGIVVAHLEPGSGIFIPGGWLHELQAGGVPTAALSVVGLASEMSAYEKLLTPKEVLIAPFFEAPYLREHEFHPERLATVLTAFLPRFLTALELDPPTVLSAMLARYGEATRHEAGLPLYGGLPRVDCSSASLHFEPEDWAAVNAAVSYFASGFQTFRRELLPHYVLLFIEQLGWAFGKSCGNTNAVGILSKMLGLLETWEEVWTSDCGRQALKHSSCSEELMGRSS